MARLFSLPSGRTTKWVMLLAVVLVYGGLASQSRKLEGPQKNESSSWLPADSRRIWWPSRLASEEPASERVLERTG